MILHAIGLAAVVCVALLAAVVPSFAHAMQCRQITRSTYIETRHPNGAVTMERIDAGTVFIANCMPEGGRVWCYVTETERTVFTMRRFLEADRLEGKHSEAVDFDICLAD